MQNSIDFNYNKERNNILEVELQQMLKVLLSFS